MTDYVKHKHEIDSLRNEITALKAESEVIHDNSNYYLKKLMKLRSSIVEIFNLVGAETQVPDSETEEQSWNRYTTAIIDKLNADK